MEFKEKVVIVTGAGSGIGEVCALKFAEAGALLSITGRNVENLNHVAQQCYQHYGKKPLVIKADLTIDEDIEKIIKETITHYGKINVLINNAGILQISGVMDDIKNFEKMTVTNVRGTCLLTQKSIPYLLDTKGNIVTISSLVTTVTIPMLTHYSMTKSALDAFTRCLALELASKGVRVNSVNPGPVVTNLFENGGLTGKDLTKAVEQMTASVPMKKFSEPDDVANIVTFLASDRAKSITGCFHSVDGGLHLGDPVLRK